MKNKIILCSFFAAIVISGGLLFYLPTKAQNTYQYKIVSPAGGVTATGNSGFVSTSSVAPTYASLTWIIQSGSFSACTIQVDYSNDGSTVAGQLIGAQTCTSSGSIVQGSLSATVNFIRVSYTITGSGVLNYSALGCVFSTCASSPGGTFAGIPNGVTISGSTATFSSTDLCGAIKLATASSTGGLVNASGPTGTQVCAAANVTAMINTGFAGVIQLGCPLILYVPLQSSGAANPGGNGDPLQGTIIIPPRVTILGCSDAGASGTVNVTTIKACPASGGPAACTSGGNAGYVPATHEFAVTAVTLTTAAGNRTYMTATIASGNIQGAEPLRFSNYQNVTNNSFPVRVCQQIQGNGSNNAAPARVDGACPISVPTATSVAFPVNSGVWSLASIGGTNTGYAGAITWNTGSTGGCLYPASGTATQSGGIVNTVTIQNRGRGCTSAPTATPYGATGGSNALLTFNIATACASNCGTLHASIPLIETGPFPTTNAFHQQLGHLTIDCSLLPDCVNFRTLTMNEGSKVFDVLATNTVERCYDAHTFTVQNSDSWDGDQCTAGASPANDMGTVAMYIGETGPHGIKDFTGNFSNATNPIITCIDFEGDYNFMYFQGGHCENALYQILIGASAPARGLVTYNWLGAPQGVSLSNGPYQGENQTAIKVRSEYYTNIAPVTTVTTSDYSFINTIRNSASGTAGTVSDDNPVNNPNANLTLFNVYNGYWITDLITEQYTVDQTTNGSENVITSAQQGTYLGSGANINCTPSGTGYYWNQQGSTASVTAYTQNKLTLWRIVIPCTVTAGHIAVVIGGADNTANTYDIGLYGPQCQPNNLCNLLANIGATAGTTFAPSAGAKNFAFTQGSTTIPAGNYLLAVTTNCATSCATLLGGTSQIGLLNANATITSAGGALVTPNIIAPANSLNVSTVPEFLLQP